MYAETIPVYCGAKPPQEFAGNGVGEVGTVDVPRSMEIKCPRSRDLDAGGGRNVTL